MNAEMGPRVPNPPPHLWHNQSPTYSLSLLSILRFYYLANLIDERERRTLPWKIPSMWICRTKRAALLDTFVTSEAATVPRSHLYFPFSANALHCCHVCVPHETRARGWVCLLAERYVLCSADTRSRSATEMHPSRQAARLSCSGRRPARTGCGVRCGRKRGTGN